MPANPALAPNSAAIVNRILTTFSPRIDSMSAGTPRSLDYEHPTYWSDPDDPLYTVHCREPWGGCSIEGLRLRIPQAALAPPASNDGHMTVVEQWNGWEWDFWHAETPLPSGGGVITIGWGGRTELAGDGLGTGDAVAAEWGNLAGIMRAQEVASGTIAHALFLVLSCDSGAFVYPATKSGGRCSDTTNAPPMGTHLWLDLTPAQIEALAIPGWQKTILRALRTHGAFMGDTGGAGNLRSSSSPRSRTRASAEPTRSSPGHRRAGGCRGRASTWVNGTTSIRASGHTFVCSIHACLEGVALLGPKVEHRAAYLRPGRKHRQPRLEIFLGVQLNSEARRAAP